MRTLIRGAELVLVDHLEKMDVVIEGSKIAQIDPASSLPVDETIEARGMLLFPGVIDDQVHFREPGLT
ncbi:MAG: dihydroorotase, partial [Pirellulaceae bacterium]